MNKWLKRFLIFTLFLLLSLFLLIVIPNLITTVSNYKADQQTLEYHEYTKQGDNFVYEFQYEDTYNYLVEIVGEYNKEFRYNTDNMILMGKNKKEIVFAEYDENSITVYCENVMNGKLTDSEIENYLESLLEYSMSILEVEYIDSMYSFANNLYIYHSGFESIIISILFDNTTGYIPMNYRIFSNILNVLNPIYGFLGLFYLIYNLIYLLYCIIKKKKILRIKERIILSLLSVFIIIYGFKGIFSFIFSIIY